ncbi:MAG: hypothetical protein IT327_08800 [Anaerolineae bacterium]|nr:hypothetical protein [Anaerolineae bacterium]
MDSSPYSTTSGSLPEQKKLISVKPIYITLGVILALALLVGFVWGIVWLARTQAATVEAVRDILLIALALESCLFGIVLLLMLLMIVRLVNMLEFEIKPILEKTNETMGTVRGTTAFVSQNVVKPVTEARVQMAGLRRAIKTLFGNPRNNIPR